MPSICPVNPIPFDRDVCIRLRRKRLRWVSNAVLASQSLRGTHFLSRSDLWKLAAPAAGFETRFDGVVAKDGR